MPLVFGGYARVSTDGQTLEAQVMQLKAVGAEVGGSKVFREKLSGAARNRPQLLKLLDALSPGDVVLVRGSTIWRVPRGTSSTCWPRIAEKGAMFRSLSDPWADTITPHGRLMLTVLGGLAEFERELIRARTSEGRARAKSDGKKMGRPYKLTPHQRQEGPR